MYSVYQNRSNDDTDNIIILYICTILSDYIYYNNECNVLVL